MKTGTKKLTRIAKGEYVYKGLNGNFFISNGDFSISKKDGVNTGWTVLGEIAGEFFRSTVESFKEAKRIAFEIDGLDKY